MQPQLPPPGSPRSDEAPIWFGATGWQLDGDWATPLRLGHIEGLSDKLSTRARCAAGVRIAARTDAAAVTLPIRPHESLQPADSIQQVVDLVIDDELVERAPLDGTGQLTFILPGRMSRVEIWLPQKGICQVGTPQLTGATTVQPVQRQPRWIAYGSSITQCAAADGPSSTWPALAARRLGWELTCLGFSGLALLDLPAARVMAAVRPEVATICAGINIYNQATFDADELAARLSAFVTIIRAGRPDTVIGVMSPITSPDRETRRNDVGMTLQDVRRTVEETARRLPDVSVISGPEVFGGADADLLPDGLHPSAAGYRLMAERVTPKLADLGGAVSGTQGVLDQPPTVVQQ